MLVLSVVALGLIRLAAADQTWIEGAYAQRIAPALSIVLTRVSGPIPISLAEMIVLGLPLVVVYRFGRVFAAARSRRSPRPYGNRSPSQHGLASEIVFVAALAAFGAASFYGAWGLNYARPTLERRLGWSEIAAEPVTPEEAAIELEALAEQLVEAANSTYTRIHGSVDAGRPSELHVESIGQPITTAALFGEPRRARHSIDGALDEGFAVAGDELALSPAFAIARGPAKAVAASTLMSRLGLAGFYFPWTGEANYNRDMPPFQLPHTIAHEKAHQRGIGSEDEANFLAYIAGLRSPSDFARYSAQLFGQRQLLRELAVFDPETVDRLVASRHAGVQRDVDHANDYWRRFEGRPADLQRDVNDAYLKAHGVEEGIEAYRLSAYLIVLYARASGGRAMGHLGDVLRTDGQVASVGAGAGEQALPVRERPRPTRAGGMPIEN